MKSAYSTLFLVISFFCFSGCAKEEVYNPWNVPFDIVAGEYRFANLPPIDKKNDLKISWLGEGAHIFQIEFLNNRLFDCPSCAYNLEPYSKTFKVALAGWGVKRIVDLNPADDWPYRDLLVNGTSKVQGAASVEGRYDLDAKKCTLQVNLSTDSMGYAIEASFNKQ